MPSQINPNNIDSGYPIAGQDNDSQGFRNNFTSIQQNFEQTQLEISDIQSKALFKSALSGDELSNDLGGALIKSPLLQDVSYTIIGSTNAEGVTDIDVSAGYYHKLSLSANASLNFTNFSDAGTYSSVRVEIDISIPGLTLTLPNVATASADGLVGYTSNVITFQDEGLYVYEFSTTDNASSIQVSELSRSRNSFYNPPLTEIGQAGDVKGNIAFDSLRLYTCIADYNGIDAIWSYVTLQPLTFNNT